jgi:hypothetical protein
VLKVLLRSLNAISNMSLIFVATMIKIKRITINNHEKMIVTHENTNIPFDSSFQTQENEVYEYYIQPTNTKQLQTIETANT